MSNSPKSDVDAHFAEMRQRVATLWDQISAGTPCEVLGILDADGIDSSQLPGDDYWTNSFKLIAWRLIDGPVQFRPLILQRKESGSRFIEWRLQTTPYEIYGFKARIVEDCILGGPRALLEEVLGKVEDEPLIAARHVLAQPVTRKDSRLGTLKLDRSTGELNGSVKWGTRRVRLSLEADDRGGYEAAQLVAGTVVEEQDAWRPRVAEAILAKMYPLWQGAWREAQKNLSEKQFLAKLKPNSISVDAGGVVEFWFDDSDLFAGHAVLVRATSGGQIESVELA